MSETPPETPPTGEGTPTPPPDDETPPDEGGGDQGGSPELPPPPVELPPPPDYQQGVDVIYGELTDPVNAPRWSTQMDNMANAVRVTYDHILPIAYEMVGDDPVSRAQARDAVASLVLTRATEENQGAHAAAELADQPEPEPEPTPPPTPEEPPAEG